MAPRPRCVFHTSLTLAAILLAGGAAFAQATAGGQIDDGNFPPGFDCSKLQAPKSRLECQTVQTQRSPQSRPDAVPPGTPAFPLPGQSNSLSGPYIAPNSEPMDPHYGRRPAAGR
jgi:hypothetical protein